MTEVSYTVAVKLNFIIIIMITAQVFILSSKMQMAKKHNKILEWCDHINTVQFKCNLIPARGLPGEILGGLQNSQQTGAGAHKGSYLCQVTCNTCRVSAIKNLCRLFRYNYLKRNYYSPLNDYRLLLFLSRFIALI